MKIRIITTGMTTIGPESISPETEQFLREAIGSDDKWLLADITDSWRSDVDTTQSVTIYDDFGTVIWAGEF